MFRNPLDSLTTNVVGTPLLASREENNVGSQERTVFFFVTLPLRIRYGKHLHQGSECGRAVAEVLHGNVDVGPFAPVKLLFGL